MSDTIAYGTIRELGARYRKRELSPLEVTKALLARIEKLDPALHAFVTPTPDPINMMFLAVPMGLLYELGIALCRFLPGQPLLEFEASEHEELVEV